MKKVKRHKPLHSEVQERRAHRQREAERVRGVSGGWELQHSPWTVEGELEGFRRLASGARATSGANRRGRANRRAVVGFFLVVFLGGPLIIGVADLLKAIF